MVFLCGNTEGYWGLLSGTCLGLETSALSPGLQLAWSCVPDTVKMESEVIGAFLQWGTCHLDVCCWFVVYEASGQQLGAHVLRFLLGLFFLGFCLLDSVMT